MENIEKKIDLPDGINDDINRVRTLIHLYFPQLKKEFGKYRDVIYELAGATEKSQREIEHHALT
jgi:hypothetical protein